MAEYIEREKLLEELQSGLWDIPVSEILDVLKYIPIVEVAPVIHGKWVWNPDGMDWGLGAWQCSVCSIRNNNLPINSKINPLMFSGSKFCPNCGAQMGGGAESTNDNTHSN